MAGVRLVAERMEMCETQRAQRVCRTYNGRENFIFEQISYTSFARKCRHTSSGSNRRVLIFVHLSEKCPRDSGLFLCTFFTPCRVDFSLERTHARPVIYLFFYYYYFVFLENVRKPISIIVFFISSSW